MTEITIIGDDAMVRTNSKKMIDELTEDMELDKTVTKYIDEYGYATFIIPADWVQIGDDD